jgi:site-specific DNA-methyltransferase (adenine-specific)
MNAETPFLFEHLRPVTDCQRSAARHADVSDDEKREELGQYNTPAWAAEILYDSEFSGLGSQDLVWEPSCGPGACLAAIPAHVPAIGTEIDRELALSAAARTGRPVLHGDFCNVPLPEGISAIFGNPPFQLSLVERLLERGSALLGEGGRCGLVLPSYMFAISRTVIRLNQRWTIRTNVLPRDLFPGLRKPLFFAVFQRDSQPHLVGFRLFKELSEMRELPEASQERLADSFHGPRSVWREAFGKVLRELGGRASLQQVYRALEGRRPTPTAWWREQLRKVAQQHFSRVGEGIYALPQAA